MRTLRAAGPRRRRAASWCARRRKGGRTRSSCRRATRSATAPAVSARSCGAAQVSRSSNPFRPPADAWSRRDFMRNEHRRRPRCCARSAAPARSAATSVVTSAAPARPGAVAVRAVPARPADHARARAGDQRATASTSTTSTSARASPRSCPGFQTPIYGYDGIYPGPTIRARKGRAAIVRQHNRLLVRLATCTSTAATSRPRTTGTRWTSSRRARSFDYRYPNEQDAAFLWYHDHAHGRTAKTLYYGLRRHLPARRRARGRARAAARRVRRAARPGRPRVQQGRLVPLRGERRPRVPRRHDPRQRRRRPADAGRAPDLPAALPQRVQRALLRAAARQRAGRWCRSRATAGCSSAPVTRATVPLHPAERIELLVDFRRFRAGSELVLHNLAGEASTRRP